MYGAQKKLEQEKNTVTNSTSKTFLPHELSLFGSIFGIDLVCFYDLVQTQKMSSIMKQYWEQMEAIRQFIIIFFK